MRAFILLTGLLFLPAFAYAAEEVSPMVAPPSLEDAPKATLDNPFTALLDDELIYKTGFGTAEDIELLLGRGANPNAVNDDGASALMIASERLDAQARPIAEHLIEAGANVNYKAKNGEMPLHTAITFSNVEMVWLLLTKGADFKAANKEGRTPQQLADATANKQIVGLLDQAGKLAAEHEKVMHSDANMQKMIQNFSYYNCAQAYLRFYVTSEQDKGVEHQPEFNEAGFQRRQQQIDAYSIRMLTLFQPRIKREELTRVATETYKRIYEDLNGLVTNEFRKRKGVGTQSDLKARCTLISSAWANPAKNKDKERAR